MTSRISDADNAQLRAETAKVFRSHAKAVYGAAIAEGEESDWFKECGKVVAAGDRSTLITFNLILPAWLRYANEHPECLQQGDPGDEASTFNSTGTVVASQGDLDGALLHDVDSHEA